MKNKARFIFPRLIGATVIVGLAALIITTLFKLLLGMLFVAGAVMLVKRLLFDNRFEQSEQYQVQISHHGISPLDSRYAMASQPVMASPAFQKPATIVPIN